MKDLQSMSERRQVMELQTKQNVKFPMDDNGIIELYFARDEKAIEETDLKYGKYLFTVAYNLLSDRLDCEECINDTYVGAWNAMPPERPDFLKAFLTVITRRIAVKRYHSKLKKSNIPSEMTLSLSELEDFVSGDEEVSEAFDAERLGKVITDFVSSLPERRQFIFMSRYYASEPIDKIASLLSLSRSMINKELAAIRSSLKEKLESEGYLV
ncbi:MAG: sigma-70 family RNA polymerase sigma factor [Ruminococcaceae bacterium]|nr:sigma-70 family RNA polymerase sigma factor [Oscillospiraceae bacterium]